MNDRDEHFDGEIDFPALYQRRKDVVGPECLTLAALEAYLHQTSPERSTAAVESHLQHCDRCAVELEYLKAFDAGRLPAEVRPDDIAALEQKLAEQARAFVADRFKEEKPATAPVIPISTRKPRWTVHSARVMTAIAASMVLMVGLTYFYKTREPRLLDGSGAISSVARGRHLELLSPLGAQPEAPRVLSWSPVAQATRYIVRITEVDGTPVWSETTATNQAPLPADIAARLIPAKTYYWTAEAQSDAGIIARSERGAFSIERPRQ